MRVFVRSQVCLLRRGPLVLAALAPKLLSMTGDTPSMSTVLHILFTVIVRLIDIRLKLA